MQAVTASILGNGAACATVECRWSLHFIYGVVRQKLPRTSVAFADGFVLKCWSPSPGFPQIAGSWPSALRSVLQATGWWSMVCPKCLTLVEQILMGGVGSSGQVRAWKEDGRFLLGCVTAALSLGETKPCTGVGFTDSLVNRFFIIFSPSPMSGLPISYETYCLAIPIYHGEKCFLLWTFKGCPHNRNVVYLPCTLGWEESNTFSLFWSSVRREAVWLSLKHEEDL